MYPAAHSGAHYLGAMNVGEMNVGEMRSSNLSRRPDQLRDIAEKLLRLASGADPAIRDRLVVHASELFDQAQQIEAGSADDDDPLIKSSPRQGRAWTIEPKNNRL